MTTASTVHTGELDRLDVQHLLNHHRREMFAETPTDFAHTLDVDGLTSPEITFFTARCEGELQGFVALRELDPKAGELKSMRTAVKHARKGVARFLLDTVIDTARQRGYGALYLETGTAHLFQPAEALYRSVGFIDWGPFGGYQPSDYNRFFKLAL